VNSIDFPNDYGDTLTYNLNRNNYLLNSSIGYGDFKFSGMFMNIDQRGSLMDTRVYRKHGIYSISYSKSLNPKLNFDAKIFGQNGSYIQDFEALNPGLSTTYPLGIYYKPQFVEYLYGFETNIGYDLLDNNSILFGLQADIHGVKDSKITANIDMGTHDPINGIGRNNQVDYTPGWIDKNGHNYNNIAFFIQDIWHPVKKLGITIGGRFDLDSEIGGIFNPRTGMVYEPFKDLSIKLLYGRAYRAPTPEEQYKTLGFIRGNKNLKPEIINTFEFEISQRFDKISNAVNIFSNKLSNMIYSQLITSINTNTSFYNIGKNSSNGIEYQFKYQAMKRFYTYLNCTYTVSENTNTINGKDTIFNQPDIAPFKINIGLNYSFLSHFSFNANTFYRSKMDKLYATDQNNQLVEVNDNIGNYWILNSTFRISNFIKKVEFSLSVYNILDTKYFSQDNERLNQPSQPGRQFIVSLIYSFK
jgi:iron complex outermembrane receptor protein